MASFGRGPEERFEAKFEGGDFAISYWRRPGWHVRLNWVTIWLLALTVSQIIYMIVDAVV